MTDWESLIPRISRLVCEDEVSGLDVNKKFIVCQFWIQPEIAVFSRQSLELIRLLEGHEYGGQCVAILDSGIVFSASLDRSLRSWYGETGECIDQANDHTDYVQCLCVHGDWVATGGQGDKKIMVYTASKEGRLTRLYTCCGHSGWVRRLAILDNKMVSGSLDMTVRVWDLSTGTQIRSLPTDAAVMSLSLPTQNMVLYGDKAGRVSFLNLESGSCTHLVPSLRLGMDKYRRALKFHDGSVDALVFIPEERLIVTGSDDKFVRLWRIENWEEDVKQTEITEIDTIREHSDYINGVVIRDNIMFSSSGDINVIIHEYPNDNIQTYVEEFKVSTQETTPFIPFIPASLSPPPPSSAPLPVVPQPIEEIILDVVEEIVPEAPIPPPVTADEVEEVSSSETSTETSSTRNKKRRWLISKHEVELKEEIGKGRYGVAFRGIYKNMVVAVKVSNKISKDDYDNTEEGIIREVGSFCRCKHPTLVRYYGMVANKEDLNFWVVTEFVTGHCLAKLIHYPEVKSLYKIRRRERLRMSACLASAVDYLHKQNLLQGDMTPGNVLVCKNGNTKQIKITDFGLPYYKNVVEDVTYTPDAYAKNINCFQPPEVLVGHKKWNEQSDIWSLGALLLEFNLENYMWDNQCIERAKSNYVSKPESKDPIRFGLKLRWSSFEFLWDALSYQVSKRPDAKKIAESMDMLITQSSEGIRTMTLCDDMILWCSMQIPLLAAWPNLAMKLQVQSVIPIVRDVVEPGEKVSVILESWKMKYGPEATVVRLVGGIQAMEMQAVVDEFYREFQIPRAVKAKKQKKE